MQIKKTNKINIFSKVFGSVLMLVFLLCTVHPALAINSDHHKENGEQSNKESHGHTREKKANFDCAEKILSLQANAKLKNLLSSVDFDSQLFINPFINLEIFVSNKNKFVYYESPPHIYDNCIYLENCTFNI